MKFYTNVIQWGNSIFVRGVDSFGQRQSIRYKDFQPTLYVKSSEPSDWKTVDGRYVKEFHPGDINESKDFIKRYDGVEGFEVFGQTQYIYQWISDNFQDDVDFDLNKILVANIDIETSCEHGFPNIETANEEVLLITIRNSLNNQYITWGTKPYDNKHDNVVYYEFDSEYKMLQDFIRWMQDTKPDVMTGWNIKFFDIPYLVNRIERVLGEEYIRQLSPWKIVKGSTKNIHGREQQYYDIFGIATLDYLDMFKKYMGIGYESFRLDNIANVILGEKKLDYSEHESMHLFYKNDWQKFVDYNIKDVELVQRLDDKLGLIELHLTMAYDARINYDDVFSQVRMWDSLVYNHLRKKKIVIPPKKRLDKDTAYAGAYVKDPVIGEHKWVLSFDLNSLYPHLIMQYNISPDTIVPETFRCSVDGLLGQEIDTAYLKENNLTMAANGQCFRKDFQGFLPEMMQTMYDSRKFFKKKMLQAEQEYERTKDQKLQKDISRFNNIQLAKKIALNSAYGALGNQYFRYFDIRQAEGITLSGQLSIRWIEQAINRYLNKLLETDNEEFVIASDTDSVYIVFDKLIDRVLPKRSDMEENEYTQKCVRFLDRIAQEKIEPYIDKMYQNLADYMNAYEQKMFMKREVIADKGIWTAKKRYILNVHNSEGVQYAEPKLKIMGLEVVKSSTPAPVRVKLKESISIIMNQDNDALIEFIDKWREEFKSLPPEEVAFPRSVNNLDKYTSSISVYTKGTPIHVRGSLMYNKLLKDKDLDGKYQLIREGEKIKFIFLKKPNPIGENVLSFLNTFPKELDLNKYIDYDTQFEKAYLEPLRFILESIGWQSEKVATLEDFFV